MQPTISNKKILFFGLAALVIIVMLTPSIYFYTKYQSAQKVLQDPAALTAKENQALIDKVSKIIELPEGESADIRTVTNKSEVANQPFFQKAENGDKVLVFAQAKKAFLFRPSTNKIINVAPITVTPSSAPIVQASPVVLAAVTPSSAPTASTSPSATPETQALNFYLLNGTSKAGLTTRFEVTLKKALPSAVVIDRDNAKSNTYDKSLLVDLTGNKSDLLPQISSKLGITTGKLPDGETKPEGADFLIIVGADKQ